MKCLWMYWQQHETELLGYLIKQTGNKQEAEDLLHDVFIKALNHKEQFCTLDDGRSWLFKLVKNAFIDSKRRPQPFVVNQLLPELEAQANTLTPEPMLLELQTCMNRVLSELSDADREIIEQCDIHKVKQQDFAERQQLKLPTVKSRLQRARRTLRNEMVKACQIQFSDNKVSHFVPRK